MKKHITPQKKKPEHKSFVADELPPVRQSVNTRWLDFVEELQDLSIEEPEKWLYQVLHKRGTASTQAKALKGRYPNQVETATRSVDGEIRLYARWTGDINKVIEVGDVEIEEPQAAEPIPFVSPEADDPTRYDSFEAYTGSRPDDVKVNMPTPSQENPY